MLFFSAIGVKDGKMEVQISRFVKEIGQAFSKIFKDPAA
jgi:hypothetical protein